MAHVNATETDLEFLRKDPPFPEKSACIITCLLEKIGIVEDGNYSKMGFMTIVSPLVFRNRKKLEHMNSVSENCDKEINRRGSACQLGNEITICIFKYAPELHFKS
ncbi:uncharacterized protein LOC123876173 [Maniola jurtina]|uniref:uncharacterized protein LOC123876173 n=1 Tax=Maniola jurtina TaxID=191418 RepID=UPI001E6887F2|nr:uncharacterized protein LOC123876173 [Maniola jurtina]